MFRWLANLFTKPTPSRMRATRMLRARYDAAVSNDDNRRHWAGADGLSANAANNAEVRRILRNRARYEVANNSYARGIVLTLANDAIGTGPRLQLMTDDSEANRRIELEFMRWAKAINLAEKLRTMRMSRAQDGEAFAVLTSNPQLPTAIQLDLRLIEADQVCTPDLNVLTSNSVDGIVFDEAGNPVEYHVLKSHPGEAVRFTREYDRLPALAVVHWFRLDRPGQARGIPDIMPALPLFAQLRRFTLAVLAAAETAADFAGILYTDAPANGEADAAEPFEPIELEQRALLTMPGGWKMSQLEAEQPSTTYGEFKHEILNEIARCLNMPFNVAAGNSSGYNYASGRLDHQTYFKSIRVEQTQLETVVLDRILAAWFDEAVLIPGLLPADAGPIAQWPHQWFWDGHEHVDPAKEATAQATRLANHTTTLAHEYARQGRDWEEALRQRAKELSLMKDLGLSPAATAPTTDETEENEDGEEAGEATRAAQPETTKTPSTLQLTATAVIEAASAAEEGATPRLPRFRMVAYTGAPMRIAGWRYPVIIDLAGLAIPSQSRPIRFSHDPTSGVGHTDSIRIDGGQLVAAGIVSRDTAAAREVVASSKNGFPWQASVGASVDEFEFVKERQTVIVNGQEHSGPMNVVRKSTLSEISFVDLGADGQTSATVAAAANQIDPTEENPDMESEDTTATAEAEATDQGSNRPSAQPVTPAVTANSAVDEIRSQAAAEVSRISAVRRICDGRFPEIEAKAIREGWDATRCELEVLRANRPRTPAIHMHDKTINGRVLEAACLMTGHVDQIDAMFDGQTLDAASERFRGGIGLQELLLEAAWANGYSGRNFRDSRAVLRYAFNPTLEAGYSTVDIGGILSNVANKFLLDGFFSVERTWRNITAVRNVSDFKTVTSYRLVGKDQYEQVAPGGELKHGTLGEEKYENKADTYGLVLSIDRRDIINDDLNAITTVPRKLGRGSGLKINDVFWTTFLANSAFFTAGNNNFISGASTALSIDGLTEGEVTFMDQVDGDGKPIGIMPVILLVPTSLSAIGSQLFKSMELRDTTASTKYPVSNPHQGKFRVEVSRYLSNAQYTGNSAKAWYLLAEATDLPVIEVAFLNGQESPTIETAEADFNKLGVQMRGYHDFGVALQDPRGGVKAKGEA